MGMMSTYEGEMVVTPFPFTMTKPETYNDATILPDDTLRLICDFAIRHPRDISRLAQTCRQFAASALSQERSYAEGMADAAAMLQTLCNGRDALDTDALSNRARECLAETERGAKSVMPFPDKSSGASYRPGIWCPACIEWDESDALLKICAPDMTNKHYYMPWWLSYLALRFLWPLGYAVDGEMAFLGESVTEFGVYEMRKSVLTVHSPLSSKDEYAGRDYATLEWASKMGFLQLFYSSGRPPMTGLSPYDEHCMKLQREQRIMSHEYRRAFFERFRDTWMNDDDEWVLEDAGATTGMPVLCREGRSNNAGEGDGGDGGDDDGEDDGGDDGDGEDNHADGAAAADDDGEDDDYDEDAELADLEAYEEQRKAKIEQELQELSKEGARLQLDEAQIIQMAKSNF